MANSTLLKFKEVVDEEIKAYEDMEELYKLKQAVLVQGKSDILWDVDAKIVSKMENIRELDSSRKAAASYLGSENMTMSEVIEKAKAYNDGMADKLQNQKTRLNVLANSLTLYEKTNMELIKHGLVMVGKRLNIIVKAFTPPSNEYNSHGKNVDNEEIRISSVVEEA